MNTVRSPSRRAARVTTMLHTRPAWRDAGVEPDPRNTLANERTFLAWIRTALALLAASVGILHFLSDDHLPVVRAALAAVVALLGIAVSLGAHSRWRAVEQAMRHGQPLPHSILPRALTVLLGVAGVAVLVLVLAQ